MAIISLSIALALLTLAGGCCYFRIQNQIHRLLDADFRLWTEAHWMRRQLGSVNNQLYRLDPSRPMKKWLSEQPEIPGFLKRQAD